MLRGESPDDSLGVVESETFSGGGGARSPSGGFLDRSPEDMAVAANMKPPDGFVHRLSRLR